jgi:ferredoxin-NADP reductase
MRSLLECFATPHPAGALLQALNPRWGSGVCRAQRRGVIQEITPTGVDAAVLRIRPGHGWTAHRPGQFVTLGVDVDGVRHHRSYTVTSLPAGSGGCVEVTVQAHPGGIVSGHLVHRARPGDVLTLDGPTGSFTLPEHLDAPVLLLSGGSGLTPVMAMLRWLATQAMGAPAHDPAVHPDVHVVHHVRRPSQLLFGGELEALAAAMPWLNVDVVVTRDDDGRALPGTHLCAGQLDRRCPDWRTRDTYACGPAPLVAAAERVWAEECCADRLRVEAFAPLTGTAHRSAPEGDDATARFARSGRAAATDSRTPLLEVAEEAGALAPAGCRMGICHTCTTELLDGEVVDLRDGRRTGSGSHVQLCVTAALTDVTLVL